MGQVRGRWLDADTGIGGKEDRFPTTKHSAILALASEEEPVRLKALDTIIGLYWKPVYKYVRIRWHKSNEDAKDLTQSFFVFAIEKSFVERYDSRKAKFRTYLRTCLDRFISNEEESENAQKRGGGFIFESLDFQRAEAELAASSNTALSPEEAFEREWIRSFFDGCLAAFKEHCLQNGKSICHQLFELKDVDPDPEHPSSYKELADRFSISVSDVTNYLSWARREFRKITLAQLAEITGSNREFEEDARALLGLRIR